jgi:hypothetical protein
MVPSEQSYFVRIVCFHGHEMWGRIRRPAVERFEHSSFKLTTDMPVLIAQLVATQQSRWHRLLHLLYLTFLIHKSK